MKEEVDVEQVDVDEVEVEEVDVEGVEEPVEEDQGVNIPCKFYCISNCCLCRGCVPRSLCRYVDVCGLMDVLHVYVLCLLR